MHKPSISIPVSNTVRWNLPGRFLLGCFLGVLPGSLLLRAAAVRLRFGLGFALAGPGLLARVVLSIGMGAERNAPHRGNGWDELGYCWHRPVMGAGRCSLRE
ncbi:hypothetical protein R2083_05315 [Nitrosomonas sp. Is35]|uniref:hypothetical protein n=1 Tax=Nitrosomonas sp. Is35 TaxID=3080534 RepID=UPI00294B4BD3|nr:hypothetical protein [Nitrosomonas sp. Is35]MDV6346934.1 hypothetical protein [Nitrosomonas sp. Is35]